MQASIFAGLKVADFTWAAAGPIVTKQLADNGATVIKVESTHHPDSVRLGGPFIDDKPGINRS
jgi:benzylsuccinate CoA-transferase BbsF subunit